MGLGYPSLSNLNRNGFFTSAHDQGAVKSNAFAFYLVESSSELYLGGTNPDLYDGDIEYHPVNTETGFWQISGGYIKVDGQDAAGDFSAIIEYVFKSYYYLPLLKFMVSSSGTTIMYGPKDSVKAFYDKIPGSKLFDGPQGLYQFPCDSLPTVAFSFGGQDWEITLDKSAISFIRTILTYSDE